MTITCVDRVVRMEMRGGIAERELGLRANEHNVEIVGERNCGRAGGELVSTKLFYLIRVECIFLQRLFYAVECLV